MSRFKDKHVLITGGSTGMGFATAKAFIAEGAHVAITGKNADNLKKAATELGSEKLKTFVSDIGDMASIDALAVSVAKTGHKLNVLFLNAGVGSFSPIESTTEAAFDAVFNVNVKGLYFTLQKLLPYLAEGASVVLNSSVVSIGATANMSAYAATKAAVSSIGRVAAVELATKKIRVNVVSPGPIDTPILGKSGLPQEAIDGFVSTITSSLPLNRIGTAAEVANAVLFLSSDEASFITGVELFVDGGASLRK
jgi:NAD(P)-dependent dehydrogenase (short-subunit alcohol dehydrogenase family)